MEKEYWMVREFDANKDGKEQGDTWEKFFTGTRVVHFPGKLTQEVEAKEEAWSYFCDSCGEARLENEERLRFKHKYLRSVELWLAEIPEEEIAEDEDNLLELIEKYGELWDSYNFWAEEEQFLKERFRVEEIDGAILADHLLEDDAIAFAKKSINEERAIFPNDVDGLYLVNEWDGKKRFIDPNDFLIF